MQNKVRIAIDPGTRKTGFVVYRPGNPINLISFGKVDNEELKTLLDSSVDQAQALVSTFLGSPVEEAELLISEFPKARGQLAGNDLFETIWWIGIFSEPYHKRGTFRRVDRKDVKMTLCDSAKAKDKNIRAAIIDLFGGEDIGIGGKKCGICDGKKGTGKGSNRVVCGGCAGTGKTRQGPLYGVSGDAWAAIGIALTFEEMSKGRAAA